MYTEERERDGREGERERDGREGERERDGREGERERDGREGERERDGREGERLSIWERQGDKKKRTEREREKALEAHQRPSSAATACQ